MYFQQHYLYHYYLHQQYQMLKENQVVEDESNVANIGVDGGTNGLIIK